MLWSISAGISLKAYEAKRKPGDDSESGDDPKAQFPSFTDVAAERQQPSTAAGLKSTPSRN